MHPDTDFSDGGIAQLVERQLCKLDVWGSNPHASTTTFINDGIWYH